MYRTTNTYFVENLHDILDCIEAQSKSAQTVSQVKKIQNFISKLPAKQVKNWTIALATNDSIAYIYANRSSLSSSEIQEALIFAMAELID